MKSVTEPMGFHAGMINNRKNGLSAVKTLFRHKELLWELTKRDFVGRYKGSTLGLLWPVAYSLLFLAMFSFVFTTILSVRWGGAGGSGAVMIFCGLVPHLFLAEVMARGPTVILNATNLVKRVRFPVQLLPIVAVNTAFMLCMINLALLMVLAAFNGQGTLLSVLIVPLILVPLYFLCLGISWLFSAIGVYFQDVSQIAPVLAQALLFLAPVFYPIDAIPIELQPAFHLNPLTYFVQAFRSGLAGQFDLMNWLVAVVFCGGFALISAVVFHRLRPAFGDLL